MALAGLILAGCAQPSDGPSTELSHPPTLGETSTSPRTAATPTQRPRGPMTVALLLPLSGQHAERGRQLEAAARASLTGERASLVNLMVLDTQASAKGARAAAQQAADANAALVLGPLFSVAAQGAHTVLKSAGIPTLSFSNNRAVAGDGLYLLGHLPGQQTAAMLRYAASQGNGAVVVVGQDTAYARLVVDAVRGLARQGTVQLLGTRLFPPSTDYNSQVDIVRALTRQQPSAAVLPTTGMPLVGLAALFDYYDARPPRVRLLGTDLWEWPGTYAEVSLRGGWYVSANTPPVPDPTVENDANTATDDDATADDATTDDVNSSASEPPETPDASTAPESIQLSSGPDKLDRLVMDAVALAAAWADQARPAADITAFLTNPAGFRGFSGLFRLLPTGLNEHALNVLEVTPKGPRLIQAAPKTFAPGLTPTALVGPMDVQAHPWLADEVPSLSTPTQPWSTSWPAGSSSQTLPSGARPSSTVPDTPPLPTPGQSPPGGRPVSDDTTVWRNAPPAPPVHAPADAPRVVQAPPGPRRTTAATSDKTHPTWTQSMGIPTTPGQRWRSTTTGPRPSTRRADASETLPRRPYATPPYAAPSSPTRETSPTWTTTAPAYRRTTATNRAATTRAATMQAAPTPARVAAGTVPPAPPLTAPVPAPAVAPTHVAPTHAAPAHATPALRPTADGRQPLSRACSWQLHCTDEACHKVQVCPIDS